MRRLTSMSYSLGLTREGSLGDLNNGPSQIAIRQQLFGGRLHDTT